jgi:hypothetical protein
VRKFWHGFGIVLAIVLMVLALWFIATMGTGCDLLEPGAVAQLSSKCPPPPAVCNCDCHENAPPPH